MVSLCRRYGHYGTPQELALDAAGALTVTGPAPDPAHLSRYGMLLGNAAYAAAQAVTGRGRVSCSTSPTTRRAASASTATSGGRPSGRPV